MNIYEAIGSIMKKGAAVGKDSVNRQQGFKYRGIDDVMNTFQPLLSEAGIFMVPEVLEAKREERQTSKGGNLIYSVLKIKYTFYAEDGSSVSAVVIGEGMDSGDKASNKAMAVAMKYAMFQTFCIPTEEMQDPDAETPPPSKPQEVPKPVQQRQTETAKEAPDGYYYCDNCGSVISGIKQNGTSYTPKDVAIRSLKKYQTQLCWECQKQHEKQTG